MTVENQTPYQSFTANGLQTNFALGFYVDNKNHFEVKQNTQIVSQTEYNYDKNSNTITFNTTPKLGDVIELKRNTIAERSTNYSTYNNTFRPEILNLDIDKIWLKVQEFDVAETQLQGYVTQKNLEQQNYSDSQDIKLKKQLEGIINQQGVSVRQLDEYYQFLLVQMANIAKDKGWLANLVVDASGKSQQEINTSLLSQNYLDVRLFGILPNLMIDQGSLINTVDAIARSRNKGLYFPSGTYLANNLLPTVSWSGDGKDQTIIKNHSATTTTGFLCLKNLVRPTLYSGITFSGNVNADPLVNDWTGIYDTWFSGSCSFVIEKSSNVIINQCSFQDSKKSTLRIHEDCSNIFVFDSSFTHARGNFGDGIYIQNSKEVYMEGLQISDVTRIGMVFEGNTKTCYIKNVNITNAHHSSIQYGGTEYNTGFWGENAANIHLSGCNTLDTGEYGIHMTTGSLLRDIDIAKFTIDNCTTNGNNIGIIVRSKADSVPVQHIITNCTSKNSKVRPYHIHARYDTDEFTIENCFGEVHGDLNPLQSDIISGLMIMSEATFTTRLPKLNVKNLTFKHFLVDISKYKDENIYHSDITFYTAAYINATFDNVRNINSTIPVYIKNRLATPNVRDETTIKNGKYFFPRMRSSGKLKIEASEIFGGTFVGTGKIRFNNSEFLGRTYVACDDVRVNNCEMIFSTNVDFFHYYTETVTNKITIKFSNCTFNKDITANDYSLRIQLEETSKAKVLLNSCEFYNSSDVTALASSHIWVVRANTSVIYQNILRDSTATLQKIINTLEVTEPTGSTSIALH